MRLKLVILIDVLENIQAGAERQVYELIKGIDKENFAVALYILHHKKVAQDLKSLDCNITGLGIEKIYNLHGIMQGFKFTNTLKKEKADILMTYHFGSDIWGTVFGKFARVPFIISNRRDEGFWRNKIHITAYKFVNRWVNKIIVVSNAVKKIVIESENVNPDRTEVIHNGVDIKRFEINPDMPVKKRELNLSEGTPIVGCIGNLKEIKGQSYLIEAAVKVLRRFPESLFILVGAGEIKDSLVSQAKGLNIENNIRFLGQRGDIPELLSIIDVCALPSLSEGLSNTLLEYMAAGKPIVATDTGGNPELIQHNINGLLVKKADSKTLADKLIALLQNKELREKFALKAKEDAKEKFSIESMIKKYEELLAELTRIDKIKINILHLISSNGLYGAEKVMLQLAQESNYNGTKAWVGALNNAHNSHLEIIDEARKNRLPAYAFESRGRFDWKTVNSLCDFLRDNNIDILHTHNYKVNLIGLLAAKKAKIPIVATLHGYIGNGFRLKLYEGLDRFILKYFNKVILVDKSLEKHFNNSLTNASVINNGIGISNSSDNQTNRQTDKPLIIGTIGRLSQEKGHKYLLEAFSKIVKEHSNTQMLVAGDGELRKELESLSIALGISEKVTFSGFQEDVAPYYQQIDIYVSSSLVEHFPMAIMEAMSFKKAIVATNVGGTPDLIQDKTTGLLINPGSADEIYKAILTYINIPSLRENYGENAHQFIKENYSLDKMVESYRKIYEDTVYCAKATLTG